MFVEHTQAHRASSRARPEHRALSIFDETVHGLDKCGRQPGSAAQVINAPRHYTQQLQMRALCAYMQACGGFGMTR